ncbi:MAG: hypothetical protein KBD24_00520 [Candidatus Pacebacteria bacterium]|nr:hypothetical protein [Candidatus Paceibacterota bacterium]
MITKRSSGFMATTHKYSAQMTLLDKLAMQTTVRDDSVFIRDNSTFGFLVLEFVSKTSTGS